MRRGLEELCSNCWIREFVVSLLLLVGIHNVQSSDNGQKLMVALTGATVRIQCSKLVVHDGTNMANAKNSIRWDFRHDRNVARATTLYIYGESHCTRCNVSIAEFVGQSYTIDTDFTIVNVQPSDAGIYGCSFGANLEANLREYELEVIKPECKLNISTTGNSTSEQRVSVNESDIVQLECNVSYWGNWRPELECQPETIHNVSHTQSGSSGGVIEYISTITATYLLHQKPVTCTMNFTATQSSGHRVLPPDRDFVAWTSSMLRQTTQNAVEKAVKKTQTDGESIGDKETVVLTILSIVGVLLVISILTTALLRWKSKHRRQLSPGE